MNESESIGACPVSLAQARHIEEVCDRFEAAWRSGQRPDIADFLAGSVEPERIFLLRELVALEIFHRQRSGEEPRSDEFLQRFPELDPASLEDSMRSTTPARGKTGRGLMAAVVSEKPPLVGDRYDLTGLHATGGLGRVWLARDGQLNRRVAVKEIRPDRRDSEARRRFLVEAEITGQLEHPGVVPIYALEKSADGEPYYAMRFVQGRTFGDAIRAYHAPKESRTDPLEQRMLFRSLLQHYVSVCETIAFAHSRGVIHRDLKPANVMLGDYGETLVVDWGLAKRIGVSDWGSEVGARGAGPVAADAPGQRSAMVATRPGVVIGTTAYMSPEQACGKWDEVGPAADVFSLGAMLYEILTNHRPYEGKFIDELLTKAQAADYLPPRNLSAAAPKPLEAVCLKAMADRPSDRYPSAQTLAQEVTRWMADEPVTAWREPWTIRTRRRLRRHRSLAAAAAALLLAAVPLLIALALVSDHARQRAVADRTEIAKQMDRADAAATTVQQEARRAVAALEFLNTKLFAAARPKYQEGGLGRDVKLADAIKASVSFVDESFKDQPLTEAVLRITLGKSFLYLGEPDLAEAQNRRAWKLYNANLGPAHRDTLTAANNLANTYSALGRRVDAAQLHEETLRLRREKLGPNDPDTLQSMINLAACYHERGRLTAALKLNEEMLRLLTAKRGRDHPDTLHSMINVAGSYQVVGRHNEALKLYEEALQLQEAKPEADHPLTLLLRNCIANCYTSLGLLPAALKLHKETLAQREERLGVDHPDTLQSMNDLANDFHADGQDGEAARLHEKTLKLRVARLGPDHPDTLNSMHDLANSYFARGRQAEALQLHGLAFALRKYKLGPEHPDTLMSMYNLSVSYDALNRDAEALELRQEALRLRKRTLGDDHPDTFMSMWAVAQTLVKLGRESEAFTIAEECRNRAQGKVVHRELIPGLLDVRLRYFARARDAASCRETVEMWENLKRTDARSLYYGACAHALTAAAVKEDPKTPAADAARLAKEEADRAMAWLQRAVDAGYREVADMKKDDDLKALREREDFKKLMKELEEKK